MSQRTLTRATGVAAGTALAKSDDTGSYPAPRAGRQTKIVGSSGRGERSKVSDDAIHPVT